jgi:hypothetical protein
MERHPSGDGGFGDAKGAGREAVHALNNRLFSIRMSAAALAEAPEIVGDPRLSALVEAISRAAEEAGEWVAALDAGRNPGAT